MIRFVVRRLLQSVPLLLVISLLIFALIHAAPGGPLSTYLENPNVRPEDIEHPGLQKLLAGLYQLRDAGERPEVDELRAMLDNPPLSAKALELQEQGRVVTDRRSALRTVLERFRDRKRKLHRQHLRDQLTSDLSPEAENDLLRKLQSRAASLDPRSSGPSP